ncbi:hypothetical protein BASA81_001690 [Batrachochytrium salamandrivorans]|nr:hypothetical protein BASA81_001690 [Batrachochytrium salamandrivorans]
METCSNETCQRPACYALEHKGCLCYFHAACLPPGSGALTLLQISTAQQQAKPFKLLASEVWDSLALELKDAQASKLKNSQTPRIPNRPPLPLDQEEASSSSKKHPRVSFFTLVENAGSSTSTTAAPELTEPCPRCLDSKLVSYVCISSAISAGKSDTWGNSSRPDRVLKYTCGACHHSWLVEEG